ncbi:MAG: hypothetical protein KJ600_01195 [Nanoarchaeota archaeon]|nr:hypothetical protein [Nanoarchaeota archaeon]MBU1103158.1 hypothetical protein [Nanoarchaeota archaeon]
MLLWGIKDISLFDIWTFIHLLSGIAIGAALLWLTKTDNKKIQTKKIIISTLLIAFLWEILEYSFEIGIFGSTISNWFYAVEFLPNRLIIDPLTVLFGGIIAIKKPKLGIPSAVLAMIFLLIHIFIFPNVVYLQRLI